jgi:hypothetical protein
MMKTVSVGKAETAGESSHPNQFSFLFEEFSQFDCAGDLGIGRRFQNFSK